MVGVHWDNLEDAYGFCQIKVGGQVAQPDCISDSYPSRYPMNRELDHQADAKQGSDDSRGGARNLGQGIKVQNVSDGQLDMGKHTRGDQAA